MALKGRISHAILNISFLALDLSLLVFLKFPTRTGSVYARQLIRAPLPAIQESERTNTLRRVSLSDSLVLPVVQQPDGKPNYVSRNPEEITQFASATSYGNVGLLAHNFLSGKTFFHLSIGQEITIEYEDGRTETFIVSEVLRYQALDSKSPFSFFQNLSNKEEILSAQQMFDRAYGGGRHITLQTCIARYGDASWGRLFVLAEPKVEALTFAP